MSRWAEAFAALSRSSDTIDTMRHSEGAPSKLSQSVDSVAAAPEPSASSAAAEDRVAAIWDEAEAEPAAVVEHDGNIQREWAEGFARLDPERPPGDVPPRRWQRFVDDAGAFLDRWAAQACALGWSTHDLFGCDRDRPFARIDRAGLLWLLNGDRLVALSDNTATIETCTGSRHTWRRKSPEPSQVLAWELVSVAMMAPTPTCPVGTLRAHARAFIGETFD